MQREHREAVDLPTDGADVGIGSGQPCDHCAEVRGRLSGTLLMALTIHVRELALG